MRNLDHVEFEHICEMLCDFAIARNMTMEQLRILCRHMKGPHQIDSGEKVLEQESREKSDLLIILEGEIEVIRDLQLSRPASTPIVKLGAGNMLGILGFVDARPHSANAFATSPAKTLSLSRKDFAHLMSRHSETAHQLLMNLATEASDIAYSMLDRFAEAQMYMQGAYTKSSASTQFVSS